MSSDEDPPKRRGLGAWLAGRAQPSRWHLVLIWVMIFFCAGVHVATGEPLLHALPWGG